MADDRNRQQQEFKQGLEEVIRAMKAHMAKLDFEVGDGAFSWMPPWRPGRTIPEALDITVRLPQGPRTTITFSREQIGDSHGGIGRADVRALMRKLTGQLKGKLYGSIK